MSRLSLMRIFAGLCAGLLLAVPDPGEIHASIPGAPTAVMQAASDTTSRQEADSLEADTVEVDSLEGDTIPRENVAPILQASTGLSIMTGSVMGSSSSEPVSAAIITIERVNRPEAEGLRTETDDYGRFRFEGIPSGRYLVKTHHIGYRDRIDTISVGHRDLVSLDIPVTTRAVELPPLRVNVRSAWLAETGFYWRKERGLGEFMSPEEVNRRSAHSFAELVRPVPGVNVVRVCDGYPCEKIIRMRHTNRARRCKVQYFMDGQRMTGRVSPGDISAQDIAAVEVYRNIAETPAQFYGRCGSVVMWSKRFNPDSGRR